MKIDRRSFLAFGIGGAAGTMVSPLPWKLMDDFSIWTQNWPWTPRPKRGEVTHADTICTLCPGGCGISVKRVGERAVKIEGMAGHPVNNGGVCLFSQAGLQFLYGETMRVTAPLARAGKRGEGQWRPISWESALDILQQKLTELRVSDQAHRVAAFAGDSRGTRPALLKRFLTAYGSPNFFFTPTMADCQELTVYLMQGADAHMGYDFAHSDFILSFGSGVLDGWGSPVRMFQAHGADRPSSPRSNPGCPVLRPRPINGLPPSRAPKAFWQWAYAGCWSTKKWSIRRLSPGAPRASISGINAC